MQIADFYSHLNGYEYLQFHKPQMWKQIEGAIAAVNADQFKTKISKERRMKGKSLYAPKALNVAFKAEFEKRSWKGEHTGYWVTSDAELIRQTLPLSQAEQKTRIEASGKTAILSYNQTDFVKDRVAVEVQFGKYAFVAFDLFVKHMAFYVGDKIDLGIEILPMKSMQAEMSSGPGYYEGELYNLIRQGRGIPAVPLIIIGIAP